MLSPLRRLLLATVALVACGPKSAETTDATTGSTTDPTTADPTAPTTGAPVPASLGPDEQLCLDFCLNLIAQDTACGRADASCYDWCLVGLQFSDTDGCGAEMRATRRCEADAGAFHPIFACEAPECGPVYLAKDVCNGSCGHLGGIPSGSGSQQDCTYASECLDGHAYEMECTTTDPSTCTCRIDGTDVGTCDLGMGLAAFACEVVDVFSGCCNDLFSATLKPAVIDEPAPVEPGTGGTATPGDPCPLVGLYLACEQDGVPGQAFCDEIAGTLQFGACLPELECRLSDPDQCTQRCELVDGEPTWVAQECMESTSG
ncbi:hypothetical protein [Nannocystis radixulma]|uniref:Uncharacterized protein n=1 Tax=Nannocystis radixulma TaxID=2995305 RepID=A0ABT5B0U9_9BACT|nr:hypothetical protein [Nannocystis radixulma]MDC0667729.1 hypothetical protein [Nannocystis radixulma]